MSVPPNITVNSINNLCLLKTTFNVLIPPFVISVHPKLNNFVVFTKLLGLSKPEAFNNSNHPLNVSSSRASH